jgi:hypothetical protein
MHPAILAWKTSTAENQPHEPPSNQADSLWPKSIPATTTPIASKPPRTKAGPSRSLALRLRADPSVVILGVRPAFGGFGRFLPSGRLDGHDGPSQQPRGP